MIVGLPATGLRLDLDPAEFIRREKWLTGTMYGSEDPAVALPLLLDHVAAGRLELGSLVGPRSRSTRIDDAVQASLELPAGRVLSSLADAGVVRRPEDSASTACSCSQLR